MRLAGRRILVTGAASGIGLAIVKRFLDQGARVAMVDSDTARLEAALAATAASADAVHGLCADVRDAAQVGAAVAGAVHALRGLDGVVNCAGVSLMRPFDQLSIEEWNDIVAVNLTGPFLVCHAALAALKAAGNATIVNVASGAGLQPIPDRVAYCAAKSGLVMFSKALAIDLAPSGIRVNALCPGLIDTPMVERTMAIVKDAKVEYDRVMAYRLIKRLGTADEMADAALFLTSSESSYMTGSALSVDGGRSFH
jgi:NAD(P)-dependent dehydrogenase (short-subunit alcohol dehydrogenase family)